MAIIAARTSASADILGLIPYEKKTVNPTSPEYLAFHGQMTTDTVITLGWVKARDYRP
ncbi:hypothetical protein D3C85_1848940 [compost metagenome]